MVLCLDDVIKPPSFAALIFFLGGGGLISPRAAEDYLHISPFGATAVRDAMRVTAETSTTRPGGALQMLQVQPSVFTEVWVNESISELYNRTHPLNMAN